MHSLEEADNKYMSYTHCLEEAERQIHERKSMLNRIMMHKRVLDISIITLELDPLLQH